MLGRDAVWRLLPSGRLDRSLARNGKRLRLDAAERVAPLRDGGFLVSGSYDSCTKYYCDPPMGMTLTRLDGSLRRVRSYGVNGERNFDGIAGLASDTVVRGDGSSVSLGWGNSYPDEDRQIMLSVDAAGRERARVDFPSGGAHPAVDLDGRGRILAATYGPTLMIKRYSRALVADESYGDPVVSDEPDPDSERRLPSEPDVHALPDGGAWAVTEAHVARITPDGRVANRLRLPPGFRVMDLTADRRGRALLVGDFSRSGSSPGPGSHAAVMRVTRAGRRDRTFGRRGVFEWKVRSFGNAIAVDGRGRIVIAASLYSERAIRSEELHPVGYVLRLRG